MRHLFNKNIIMKTFILVTVIIISVFVYKEINQKTKSSIVSSSKNGAMVKDGSPIKSRNKLQNYSSCSDAFLNSNEAHKIEQEGGIVTLNQALIDKCGKAPSEKNLSNKSWRIQKVSATVNW